MDAGSSELRVFVSSTSEDLKVHRAVARMVIDNLRWRPVMMEDFGASPTSTVEACRRELETCQLVLLIVAFRRGFVPTVEQGGNGRDSITALELAHARARGIPVLVLAANDDWPRRLCDTEPDAMAWINEFRATLGLPWEPFPPELGQTEGDADRRLPGFREVCRKVLLAHQQRLLDERQAARALPDGAQDRSALARDSLLDGSCVPVIGPDVFGNGPLGVRALAQALGEPAQGPAECLATVAELCEQQRGARSRFLAEFSRAVAQQSKAARLPPSFQMLLALPRRPPVIVCTTYDLLLEEALLNGGVRAHVVLTHILRSVDNTLDGRILVLRPDEAPVIATADTVKVRPDEVVIYRPLGSPLLADRLDPDLDIDTVVITESDHLLFLRRLNNEHMKVPACLTSSLRRQPLLFLGYGLDVWQYRLFVQVFSAIGGRKSNVVTLAVRRPTTRIEEGSWDQLHAQLIQQDPNQFASAVLPLAEPA